MAHLQFHEMGLDDRLLKAIAKLGWAQPTLIQEKAIPLALEGKDVLVRAKTGSGKNCSVVKPKKWKHPCGARALIIVPSKELCLQAARNVKELLAYCPRTIKVLDVCNVTEVVSQRTILLEKPDVVVGTPSRILAHLQQRTWTRKGSLELLVIDEADLVFSYGYEQDLKPLSSYLPSIYQACLMSATRSEDVQTVRKLVLHTLCSVEDKFLLIYTLLKLKSVYLFEQGHLFLFLLLHISNRLKLFLEQFCIKSCVLNSELPHNSRTARGMESWSSVTCDPNRRGSLLEQVAANLQKEAVKEARMKEIRTEILNSEKLKHHFEDNPRDLQVLRHDNVLQPTRVQPHLKHVPSYLMPKALQQMVGPDSTVQLDSSVHLASKKPRRKMTKKATSDPLKSFSYVPKNAKPQRKSHGVHRGCQSHGVSSEVSIMGVSHMVSIMGVSPGMSIMGVSPGVSIMGVRMSV
eukprot:Em0013g135a